MGHVGSGQQADWDPARSPLATQPPHNPLPHSQVATLELSGAEKAAMGLLKDPRTVKFFKKFLKGYGLTKISHKTIMTSSALFLLRGKNYDAKT